MPLGNAYSGSCRAVAGQLHVPEQSHQREVCNRGYARGRCDRFPDGEAVDAVRFSVAAGEAGRLRLVYILEKDHAPSTHGSVEFSVKEDVFPDSRGDELLASQARAFVESYLRLPIR